MSEETTLRIRRLNDQLRTEGVGGKIFLTRGIASLPEAEQAAVIAAVRRFSSFSSDNDPWGEHDCAAVEVGGQSIIWKLDYYNGDLTGASCDPSDPVATTRVLTIMLANEY